MMKSITTKFFGIGLGDKVARWACGMLLLSAGAAQAAIDPTRFSLEELMALPVSGAAKYDQPQSLVAAAASVITRDEIGAFGWQTLAEVLASLPGIYTSYDRQYRYLGVHGFGLPGDYNTRVLLTINGSRVNDPVYNQTPIGGDFPLDLNLVERIEFIPGPGAAMYGPNAMFGVINVVTRKGADIQGAEASVRWSSLDHATEGSWMLGRQLDDGTDVLLSVSGLNAPGQDLALDFGSTGVSGKASGMDQTHRQRLFAQFARDHWSFELIHGERYKADPTASYLGDPLVPGAYNDDIYTLANWRYQDQFRNGTLHLTGRLFAGTYRYGSRAFYGAPVDMPAQGDWRGTELHLLSTAVPDHKTVLGLEFQDNVQVRQQVLYAAQPASNVDINRPSHWLGIYLQDEWRLNDEWTAILGLRGDTSSLSSFRSSPRLGLIWQPSTQTTVKAMLGRAYRNPNAFESDYGDGVAQVANPALGPETVDSAELVVDYRLQAHTSVRGSAYHSHMQDLIVLGIDPSSGLTQYQAGRHIDLSGLALSFDHTWGNGGRLRGSVAWRQTTYADGSPAVNSPARLFKVLASLPLPWAGANLSYELLAESPRRTLNGSTLGGYGLSGVYLRWILPTRRWEFGVGVANLGNKHYQQPAADTNWQNALAQDGRSLSLQAIYRF